MKNDKKHSVLPNRSDNGPENFLPPLCSLYLCALCVKFFEKDLSENILRLKTGPGKVKQMMIIGKKDGV